VHHSIGDPILTGWENTPTEPEELYISTYGKDTSILKQFIEECMHYCIEKDKDKIAIYELHRWFNGWTKVQKKKPRPIESVILDKDNTKMLCEDIIKYKESQKWYHERGIPYRRGYLLYGPPGTGKTSFTLAVAGALKLNICYLNLSSGRLDDDSLNDVLSHAPHNSIILLEDIDAIFVQREAVSQGEGCGVSFSGLLNALDGVRAQEGSILFMTTNHKEKLDPALLRPGRCDVHVELCNATYPMIKGLFLKFYPGEDELANDFAKSLPERKISMAKLQGHFLKNKGDPEKAI
jgi:chaperone BCS1